MKTTTLVPMIAEHRKTDKYKRCVYTLVTGKPSTVLVIQHVLVLHRKGWWTLPLRAFNIGGITLGKHIFLNPHCNNYKHNYSDLVNHELEHVRQYLDEGWRFYFKYYTGHRHHYETLAETAGKTRKAP